MPYITNESIKIRYEVIGSGTPIIFHHGFGNCIEDWHELGYVDGLKDYFQLVLIDSRGFGQSSKPSNPQQYALSLCTSDTIAVMNHLNIEKAVAFGNSMGGRMVFALMKYYPQRFNAFIAIGSNPFSCLHLNDGIQTWLKTDMLNAVQQVEKNYGSFPGNMRQRYLKNDIDVMRSAFEPMYKDDLSSSLKLINAPTLLCVGSKDSHIEAMQQAQSLIKNSELQLLTDFDHAQAYWRGDIASEIIKNFMNKHLSDL